MMELVKDKRVRKYELTYLLPAALSSSEVASAKEAIEQLLKKHKITIVSQEDWGKKYLAYPIKYKSQKQDEAFYTYMVLEAESSKMPNFENDLYLKQEVIRHLIVVIEGKTPVAE
jgi:ribosomal protein S6